MDQKRLDDLDSMLTHLSESSVSRIRSFYMACMQTGFKADEAMALTIAVIGYVFLDQPKKR